MDKATGMVVASESRLANDAMNLKTWACNRRVIHALFTARKLAERREFSPALKFVVLFTDSRVAHAGEFKYPFSSSVDHFSTDSVCRVL